MKDWAIIVGGVLVLILWAIAVLSAVALPVVVIWYLFTH